MDIRSRETLQRLFVPLTPSSSAVAGRRYFFQYLFNGLLLNIFQYLEYNKIDLARFRAKQRRHQLKQSF